MGLHTLQGLGSLRTALLTLNFFFFTSLGILVGFRTQAPEALAVLKIIFIISETLTHGKRTLLTPCYCWGAVILLLCYNNVT